MPERGLPPANRKAVPLSAGCTLAAPTPPLGHEWPVPQSAVPRKMYTTTPGWST